MKQKSVFQQAADSNLEKLRLCERCVSFLIGELNEYAKMETIKGSTLLKAVQRLEDTQLEADKLEILFLQKITKQLRGERE